MKRLFLVLALAALVAGGVFADSMFAAGGGFSFSGGRVGGFTTSILGIDVFGGSNALGFGGHVFFDARFAEASIGVMGGPVNAVATTSDERETERAGSLISMELSLLGKIPLDLGNATFFPLLGIGANLALSFTDEDGNTWTDEDSRIGEVFSTFRIKFGVGADFGLADSVFLRVQGLGWYGFAPSSWRDTADIVNLIPGVDANANGGFGGSVRLAVGFRF